MGAKPNLDLLRAFAVVAVLADHTCQILRWRLEWAIPLGLFGVYLFFVHTTLVLMWSLERRPHTLDFYTRRVFRIYPLALVTVAVVLLLHLPVAGNSIHPFAPAVRTHHALLANVLLIQNLMHQPPTEAVMWSLPLEVQMYVVLPMIFMFARKERTLWPILLLWSLAAGVSWSLLPHTLDSNMLSVVPNFLPGVVAYVGFMHRRAVLPSWVLWPLVGVLGVAFILRPSNPVSWSICLALGLILPSIRQATNRVLIAVGHTIAKYSYSIYLLHLWSLALAFHYLHLRAVWGIAVELGSLAILAPLAYHFIEHPMVRFGSRIANRVTVEARELELV